PAGTTRANPLPPGTALALPGWRVELLECLRGAEANELMRKANSNNEAPPNGMEYLLLRVRATSTAQEAQYRLSDLHVVGSATWSIAAPECRHRPASPAAISCRPARPPRAGSPTSSASRSATCSWWPAA